MVQHAQFVTGWTKLIRKLKEDFLCYRHGRHWQISTTICTSLGYTAHSSPRVTVHHELKTKMLYLTWTYMPLYLHIYVFIIFLSHSTTWTDLVDQSSMAISEHWRQWLHCQRWNCQREVQQYSMLGWWQVPQVSQSEKNSQHREYQVLCITCSNQS